MRLLVQFVACYEGHTSNAETGAGEIGTSIVRSIELVHIDVTRHDCIVTPMSFVIRCGTPDCGWGHKMRDMGEDQLRLCYSEFRKHCIQRHNIQEWDTTPHVHLDLENW